MKLYHYYRSSTSYRVRIALNIKGIKTQNHHINLLESAQHKSDYLAINPLGGVPTLCEGDFALSQSLAIIDYLEQIQPVPALLPSDLKSRAFVQQIAAIIAEDIHPLINIKTQKYLTDNFGADAAAKSAWYAHWTSNGLAAIEKLLERRTSAGHFVTGNTPTLADICLIPHLYSMRRFNVPLHDFPLCKAIEKHCVSLPEFIAAAPESQPEAPEGLEQIHGKNAAL